MRPHDESFASLAHAHPGRKPGGGAIYHMKVWTASRSKGQSARAPGRRSTAAPVC